MRVLPLVVLLFMLAAALPTPSSAADSGPHTVPALAHGGRATYAMTVESDGVVQPSESTRVFWWGRVDAMPDSFGAMRAVGILGQALVGSGENRSTVSYFDPALGRFFAEDGRRSSSEHTGFAPAGVTVGQSTDTWAAGILYRAHVNPLPYLPGRTLHAGDVFHYTALPTAEPSVGFMRVEVKGWEDGLFRVDVGDGSLNFWYASGEAMPVRVEWRYSFFEGDLTIERWTLTSYDPGDGGMVPAGYVPPAERTSAPDAVRSAFTRAGPGEELNPDAPLALALEAAARDPRVSVWTAARPGVYVSRAAFRVDQQSVAWDLTFAHPSSNLEVRVLVLPDAPALVYETREWFGWMPPVADVEGKAFACVGAAATQSATRIAGRFQVTGDGDLRCSVTVAMAAPSTTLSIRGAERTTQVQRVDVVGLSGGTSFVGEGSSTVRTTPRL